ncbi:MAG: glutamate--tRNA ligase [Candidatus Parcubacteria bacterium]|nr:glutamate--tRNA ligase [Candidatus Parcubacteria bacterium]
MEKIITRFPPSPTGPFHVGNARTALFNYLFTKKNNGKMIFRMEDTDKERSKKEFEKDIIDGLRWLGIGLDFKNFPRQSERSEIYKKYLTKLLDENKVYREGDAVRFKNPNKKIKFNDLIRGEIEFDTTELKDFVIAKNLEEPIYHLAVVIDDFEAGVTHVIRGEDHISNTPRQILIQEAISAPRPIYAHLPLILGPDKSKLGSRHGATSLNEYQKLGYLPEAMVNFLALLGWNPGTEEEVFGIDELIEKFDLKKVQKAGAIFNVKKLDWLNKQYIKKMPLKDLAKKLLDYLPKEPDNWEKIVDLEKERISKLSDIKEGTGYFFEEPVYNSSLLIWKDSDKNKTKDYLEQLLKILCDIPEGEWTKEGVKGAVWDYTEKEGRGNVLWPLRTALTGLERSPEPFIVADIIGKQKTINRLKSAIIKIC